jgi:Ca2+/Na+ antiporter
LTTQILDPLPLWALYVLLALFLFLMAEAGYQLGRARERRHPDEKEANIGTMAGATLGMLAFILAFMVGSAADRFGTRRQLVVEEANAIRTAYLRAGYVPEPYPDEIRPLLREYVDVRLAALDPGAVEQALARSEAIHLELWARAEALARDYPSDVIALFVESTNEIVGLHALRLRAVNTRIPESLWLSIYALSGLAMLMVGLHNSFTGQRNLFGLVALVLSFTAVILLIADLDRPTGGFLEVSQQALIDLQDFMASYP